MDSAIPVEVARFRTKEGLVCREVCGAEGIRSPTGITSKVNDGPEEKSSGPLAFLPMIRGCLRGRRGPAESDGDAPERSLCPRTQLILDGFSLDSPSRGERGTQSV